jgi:hypothetical protein
MQDTGFVVREPSATAGSKPGMTRLPDGKKVRTVDRGVFDRAIRSATERKKK